jgi:hypothetical protein
VMNIKDDDRVSAVALVVESDTPEPAAPPEAPADELPAQDGAGTDGEGG